MHDTRVLNDVAVKSNNLMDSSAALDQNQNQRDMINWAMSQAEKDNQFKVGAFGTTFPTGWFNTLLNSGNMSGASQLTKDYVVSVLSLREAAMGMQKVLTGSARANEAQIAALQATVPGLETNSALARQKLAAFTQNVDMLRQGLPRMPGIDVVPVKGPRAAGAASGSQPTGSSGFNWNNYPVSGGATVSTTGTIPFLGTDGQVHSIPQDQVSNALAAGGKPVAQVRDPQGQMRYIPSNQVETARAMGGAVVSRAPQSEELDFLQKNPGHAWLSRDPQKFPNREEGIYPSGPGNEWRNDPTSPMASNTQAPIDLHLGLHTYQGMKTGLLAATAPLALEASVPQLIGGLAGGTAGSYAGQKIAQAAGAGPVGQEIAGDVGGLAGGALGARQASGFVRNFRAGLNPPATATYPGAPLPETPPTAVLQASSLARGPQPVIDRAQGLGSIPVAKNFPGAPYPENPRSVSRRFIAS